MFGFPFEFHRCFNWVPRAFSDSRRPVRAYVCSSRDTFPYVGDVSTLRFLVRTGL